jgi:hypothetical protein
LVAYIKKLTLLFILNLISFNAFALSIVCPIAGSDEQRLEWLNEFFQNSEIVVQLGNPILTDSAATRHKVLRVWKGAVGEYIYLDGGGEKGLLFASRVNHNGPLKPYPSGCRLLSSDSSKVSTIDLLTENYGVGYKPDPTIKEIQHATTFVDWFFMFGFVLLVLISMTTYVFVRAYQFQKRKV